MLTGEIYFMGADISRKEEIKKAFAERYYHLEISEIKVSDICQDISMSRTAFYYYYNDIYDVLEDIEGGILKELIRLNRNFYLVDMRKDDEAVYQEVLPTLRCIKDNSLYLKALLRHKDTDNFHVRLADIIKSDWKKKMDASSTDVENADIVLNLTAAAIVGLYEYWLYHLEEFSERDIFEGINRILCGIFRYP